MSRPRAIDRTVQLKSGFPRIVCLCGSTRFKDEFIAKNFEFTKMGYIVLTVGWFSHADAQTWFPSADEKIAFDILHKCKIDLADDVYVINKGGYIGDSTRSEIDFAQTHRKLVEFMEPIVVGLKCLCGNKDEIQTTRPFEAHPLCSEGCGRRMQAFGFGI